jgi:ADP-heptose:LPS heptosyltransferase/Tfp pilus assembly protein PilF
MEIEEYYNKAVECVNSNDNNSAIEHYKKIISLNPKPNNIIKYYTELANIYKKINKNMNAITECYINIIKLEPLNGIILNEIGICYFTMKQYKLAIHYFNKVIKIKEIPDVYCNIGTCFVNSYEYKNAENNFLLAYNLDKKSENTTQLLAKLYYYIGSYDKAIKLYMKVNMENTDNLYNLSFCHLAKQNFKKGFELYENRLVKNIINPQTGLKDRVDIPQIADWNGVEPCKSLLIVYEQGIGDNIQFYRFIIDLSKKYPKMKIGYFCRNDIAYIFKEYENIKIIENVVFSDYNYKIYIMSLVKILNLNIINPNKENYILLNSEKNEIWKDKVLSLSKSNKKKLKIGFAFRGLLNSFIEKYIPLIEFHNKFNDLDIDLICIHRKCDIEEELKTLPSETNITHFELPEDKTFEDIIAILKNVDLLITVDTYIGHLAGTLNVPTWLFIGYSDWRWSTGTNKTYWYNSVELIRKQKQDDDFKDILIIVKNKLIKYIKNYKEKHNI